MFYVYSPFLFRSSCWLICVLAAAVLALAGVSGCTRTINAQATNDLVWTVYPGYERVRRHCYLIVEENIRSFVVERSYPLEKHRLQFGESLAACLPLALSKVFDEVTIVSSPAEAQGRSSDSVVLRITGIDGDISAPPTAFSEATAQVLFDVEIRSKQLKGTLTEQFVGRGRVINNTGWLKQVVNGAVEEAGNALTRYVSINRQHITGD